ncbi:MAG: UDP-N-acetylmuramoyl-L-alanine--D-glutamate ligase [Gammaproteobacteria bacterium]|nr:UDP-N-acetylmuramoyl-L-alanine--D-glutamate ligase [Gammaproteobacteria bacterium]
MNHATAPQQLQKKTLVLGLGKSGQATVRFLMAQGVAVIAADTRLNPPGLEPLQQQFPDLEIRLGPLELAELTCFERMVLSPGLSYWDPIVEQTRAAGVEVVGDVELFSWFCDAPVVAITGSNGKSTVTTLVAEMATMAGLRVQVGGNLGIPILELLPQESEQALKPQLYVIELSSFQLESTFSLKAAAAVVLNISPDHMDRYRDLDHYTETKGGIYRGAEQLAYPAGDAVIESLVAQFGSEQAERTPYGSALSNFNFCVDAQGQNSICRRGKPLLPLSQLRIAGRHNWSNALAALTLGEVVGIRLDAMLETLQQFKGLPHRTEWIAEEQGIRWINDSKGTNLGATLAAIEGLSEAEQGKVVLIAGGQGKGADFSPLYPVAERQLRAAVLMGEDAALLEEVLPETVARQSVESMQAAVSAAAHLAEAGDTILLSPACASFDQYSGFEVRGDSFRQAVTQLLEQQT